MTTQMIQDLLFYLGLALLLTHELDAVQRHEWRIFPLISNLKDEAANHLFVILHVPILVVLFFFLCHPSENVRYWFQLSMDVFFVVHLCLHLLFKSHKHYEFTGLFSKTIIFLLAFTGFVHLGLLLRI